MRVALLPSCFALLLVACTSGGANDSSGAADASDGGLDQSVDADGASDAGADTDVDAPHMDAQPVDAGPLKALCDPLCAKLAQAACPGDPALVECVDRCMDDAELYAPPCLAVVEAYWQCKVSSATYVCSGFDREKGCINEYIAAWACAICVPTFEYDACDTCRAQKCCSEWSSFFTSPEFEAYMQCQDACASGLCGCGWGGAADAMNQCAVSMCATECV